MGAAHDGKSRTAKRVSKPYLGSCPLSGNAMYTPASSFIANCPCPSHWAYVCWLAMCLTPFVFIRQGVLQSYLPKMIWMTGWMAAAFAVTAVCAWQRGGCASGHSSKRAFYGPFWSGRGARNALLFLYFAWAAVSLSWSDAPALGVERGAFFLLLIGVYHVAAWSRFWQRRGFWDFLCAIACVGAAIGLAQYGWANAPWVHTIPGAASPQITLGHRNYASLWLSILLPIALWRYMRAESLWRAWLPLAAIALICAFLMAAKTRSVWLGTGMGALGVVAGGGWRLLLARDTRMRTALLLGLSATALVVGLIVRPIEFGGQALTTEGKGIIGVGGWRASFRALVDSRNRFEIWEATVGKTPVFLGAGFGSFPLIYSNWRQTRTLDWQTHNDYLQNWQELGVPGASLYGAFWLLLVVHAFRDRRRFPRALLWIVLLLASAQMTTFLFKKLSTLILFAGLLAWYDHACGQPVRCGAGDSHSPAGGAISLLRLPRIPRWAGAAVGGALVTLCLFHYARSALYDSALFDFSARAESWATTFQSASAEDQASERMQRERWFLMGALSPWPARIERLHLAAECRHLYSRRLTVFYAQAGAPVRAERMARVGLGVHPTDALLHWQLILALEQQGPNRRDALIAALEHALQYYGDRFPAPAQNVRSISQKPLGRQERFCP